MPSTYSTLKLQKMATGENTGDWGNITNLNLEALEDAVASSATINFTDANVTLSLTNSNIAQDARNIRLSLTGSTTATRELVVPTIEKLYIVSNGVANTITVKTSAGTGIDVPSGKTMWVVVDGTNVVDAVTHLTSLTLETDLAISEGGTGSNTASGARTSLGLAIGTDVQAWDPALDDFAGLTQATDTLPYFDSASTMATTALTSYGRSLLDDADASTARGTLGLGSMATQASSSVTITGGSISGITDLALADGGTGASTAAGARTNLGLGPLATASSVDIISDTTGTLSVARGGTGATTASAARTALGLAIGSDVQAYSSVLANTTASFTTALNSKLAGIEALADVTDQTNVSNAGGSIISSGASNPATTPSKVGDIYINTTADTVFLATGTASSADWTSVSGTGDGDLLAANNLSELTNFTTARSNLGLTIGSDIPSPTGTGASGTWGINITGDAAGLSSTLPVADGGTGQTTYTNGQLLIGNTTGNTLTKATLTAGSGIQITNGAGSITISNTGSGGTVTSVGVSGGTTGLTTSGGPVTTSGTITIAGTLVVANGGTGATTASGARTNLGLGTLATQNTITLGTDTTGTLPVSEGGTGRTTLTLNNYLKGNGTSAVSLVSTIPFADITGTVPIDQGGTNSTTAAGARANLGLAIGTDVQAQSAVLSDLAGLTQGTDLLPYFNSTTTATTTTLTSFGRSLIDDIDAGTARGTLGLGSLATQSSVSLTADVTGTLPLANGGTAATTASGARTNLGLGSIATQNSSNVTITGGSISGITDLALADGGTGASTASGARTNLGLGSVATLNSISLTTNVTGVLPLANGGTNATTASAARSNLGLIIGSQVQAWDAYLDDIAAISNPAGDQILFIDDTDNTVKALAVGTGLTISGTTISADNNGTVTSVGTTGSVNGITLTGTVTAAGNLTLGGTLAINNNDWSGTDLAVVNGGTGSSTASGARANLGAAASGANTDITALDQDVTVTASGTIAADSIGYRGLPQNSRTSAYTLALSDAGKHISITTGGVTIPANSGTAFPVGTSIAIFNNSASNQTISITTDTLRQAGTANTGSRTLAQYGICTVTKVASTVWVIAGSGVS